MYGTVSTISLVPVGGVNALTHATISFMSWVQYVYACSYKCSYAVRDFVLLLACGHCPDDGLLLSLCFEEGPFCLCSSAVAIRILSTVSSVLNVMNSLVTPAPCYLINFYCKLLLHNQLTAIHRQNILFPPVGLGILFHLD